MNWLFVAGIIVSKVANLDISVKEIEITQIPVYSIGENYLTEDEYLVVLLSMKNTSNNQKIDILSWRKSFMSDNPSAELYDEFQNQYYQLTPRFSEKFIVDEEMPKAFSVYPQHEEFDILIFQKPAETSKNLELVLPGNNIGQILPITINIPKIKYHSPIPTVTNTHTITPTSTCTYTQNTPTITYTKTQTFTPTQTYTKTLTPSLTPVSPLTKTPTPTKTLYPILILEKREEIEE